MAPAFVAAFVALLAFQMATAASMPEYSKFNTKSQLQAMFQPEEYMFDFNDIIDMSLPSQVSLGGLASFPTLVHAGVSIAVVRLAKCALNSPHVHPFASEFAIVIEGENIIMGHVEQNGGRTITNTVDKYGSALFPQGLQHFQFNDNCYDAVLIAALSDEDPGVSTVPTALFSFEDYIVAQATGLYPEDVEHIDPPSSPVPGMMYDASCLKRCGGSHSKKEKDA